MDSALIFCVYSIGYCYRYVRTVLEGPLLDSTSRWYELLIFAIFVSYLSCMLLHLNEKMKCSLLFVILGYFTFFTIEIFGNITTKIACYPFLNIWGYILAGWLLLHITWTRKEKTAGIICWILSIAILELEYFCYPDALQMEDFYFIFKCITILGVLYLMQKKKTGRGDYDITCSGRNSGIGGGICMIAERKGYQTSYGLLCILACIFVIIHHFDAVVVDTSSQKGMAVVDNLTMVNNGLFFLLSGKFALEYFDGNVTAYYRKRFVKIAVPYLVINCAINMMHGYTITEYISRLRHGYERKI